MNMSSQTGSLSPYLEKPSKIDNKVIQFGSQSSRSDRIVSASKSLKAFEDSLRQDAAQIKPDDFNSPLKKKLAFGKNEKVVSKQKQKIYVVDTNKKIKKVESPFKSDSLVPQQRIYETQAKKQTGGFDSISQKIEDQGESSIQIEKANEKSQEMDFDNLAFQIKDVFNGIINDEERKENYNLNEPQHYWSQTMDVEANHKIEIFIREGIENEPKEEISVVLSNDDSFLKSSANLSLKSKSSETIRQRIKEGKIKKRKQKKKIAKSVKLKLKNITNFVGQLKQKQVHTDRKQLISQLNQHLCESKFGRLRNELKKLI